MADTKVTAFIRKMKTRDMRVSIQEDFRLDDLDFDSEKMVALIVEEGLPLDFIADTMVISIDLDGFLRAWNRYPA
jgi:hypothetical protein